MKHALIRYFSTLTLGVVVCGTAWAQSVTYRPVDFLPVPALGGIAMLVLAVLLVLLAWRIGRSGQWMNRVAGIAILGIAAASSLTLGVNNIQALVAATEILIQDEECYSETTETWDPYAPGVMLKSECSIEVEVTAVEFTEDCVLAAPTGNECEAGTVLENSGSCDLPVCEPVVAGECQNGAVQLSVSPGGDMMVCDDPTDTVCEQDVETLCPAGWQLCSYQQHVERNTGWLYPLTPAGNVVVAEIYCRGGGGAGHFTLGTYESPADLSVDIAQNCHYGSSRESCTSTYGCNETQVQALCCLPSPSCGNGVVDSPEEQCDDGNQDETDDCLNSCTFRLGSGTGCG